MTEDSVGNFIQKSRKRLHLTQKDLAQKLRVTDKAVSKWERGLAYPDITLIPKLAEIFDVSVEEIMLSEESGQTNSKQSKQERLILATDKINRKSVGKKLNIAFIAVCLVSIFTIVLLSAINLLINSATNSNLLWSIIPSANLLGVMAVFATAVYVKKHKLAKSLAIATVASFGLLFVIEVITPAKGWPIQIGLPIICIVMLSILVSTYLKYKRANNFLISAFCVFASLVISIISNQLLVPNYLKSIDYYNQANLCINLGSYENFAGQEIRIPNQVCIDKPSEEEQAISNAVNYISLSSITIILLFIGLIKTVKK